MLDLLSFVRGILARRPYRGDGHRPGWWVKWWGRRRGRYAWWCHLWTPKWHEGRGPYVSIGLGWFAIYRGY